MVVVVVVVVVVVEMKGGGEGEQHRPMVPVQRASVQEQLPTQPAESAAGAARQGGLDPAHRPSVVDDGFDCGSAQSRLRRGDVKAGRLPAEVHSRQCLVQCRRWAVVLLAGAIVGGATIVGGAVREEASVDERRPPRQFCRGRVSEDEALEGFARLTQAAERGGVGCLRRAASQQVVMKFE